VRGACIATENLCVTGIVVEAYLDPGVTCSLGRTELRASHRIDHREYQVSEQSSLGHLVGASEPMRELYGLLQAVAPSAATVLIQGESGSGKEMVARTLHELSGRRGTLAVFDASVADKEMMRSDLFGHVKGAFTGAQAARDGAFRHANGGTLFIDEIGELPLDLQPRLLRALENREVTPVGSDRAVKVDVRLVAATHRDLRAMVDEGRFRADLYYRLSVVGVRVPALREIPSDIPLLAASMRRALGIGATLSEAALAELMRHSWPGNARELRNVLERAALVSGGGPILPEHLQLTTHDPRLRSGAAGPVLGAGRSGVSAPDQLKRVERDLIAAALARNDNNKAATARELGLSLSTLKRRVADYGL
jgi:DNA-binding NtrC family response regulator